MKLNTPVIESLREHLLSLSRSSILPSHGASRAQKNSPEEDAALEHFRPFAELFYLVAVADGQIDGKERAVILGAFRALSGGRVKASALQALEAELRERLEIEEHEAMLEEVCSALAGHRENAEFAFTLASAVALADERLDPGEEKLLTTLASWLGISATRISELTCRSAVTPQ